MIADFLFSIPAFILSAVLQILPQGGTVPTEFISAVYQIWGDINAFSFIVPITTLLTVLSLAFALHIGIFIFKSIHWIITKIPFIG